jgi:hypothetical protein
MIINRGDNGCVFLGFVAFNGFFDINLSIRGSRYANVFPEPVSAVRMQS